mmetsp:Transcript_2726/g.3752  ORF Transcript_2726/g.3752 Transcript_2726/m.3752 type:complete len:252 (-) Transcript_2726:681-1436(-)
MLSIVSWSDGIGMRFVSFVHQDIMPESRVSWRVENRVGSVSSTMLLPAPCTPFLTNVSCVNDVQLSILMFTMGMGRKKLSSVVTTRPNSSSSLSTCMTTTNGNMVTVSILVPVMRTILHTILSTYRFHRCGEMRTARRVDRNNRSTPIIRDTRRNEKKKRPLQLRLQQQVPPRVLLRHQGTLAEKKAVMLPCTMQIRRQRIATVGPRVRRRPNMAVEVVRILPDILSEEDMPIEKPFKIDYFLHYAHSIQI